MSRARKAYDLARAGDVAAAILELTESARIAPRNPLYHSALGGMYERQGMMENAVLEFGEALRLDSTNVKLRDRLESVSLEWGATLAAERRFRAGLAHAQATAARFPQSSRAHIMLGLFETRNQQNLAAVAAYRRAVRLDPKSVDASLGLAMAQSNAGLNKDAESTFEQGIKAFPDDAMHRQAYGVLLVKMAESGIGAQDRAVRMLRSALSLDAKLTEAHYQLGSIALAHGDATAAAEHFASAAANGLDDSRLHFGTARALRRLGRTEEAARQMELFQERKRAEEAGSQR
jgi:Flp pilus assembly protein TadD